MDKQTFSSTAPITIGVDIGGSHITAARIDFKNQCIMNSTLIRSAVNTNGCAEEILKSWATTIRKVMGDSPTENVRIGVAMPGPFDYKNGISLIKGMNKYEALFGIDIGKYLRDELGLKEDNIAFKNDAEAFLHGEVHFGSARKFEKVIGITLGTGLGSAVSLNGVTVDSNLGVSNFRDGIAEDYLSTRWFVKRYAEISGKKVKDVKEIVTLSQQEDAVVTVFNEFCQNLSEFLSDFILKERADIAVIGGNIAKAYPLFLGNTQNLLFKKGIQNKIHISSLAEDAAMLGAACVFKEQVIRSGKPIRI